MLTSYMIGNTHADNNWKLVTDKYDNAFISNESIAQKIRIGNKVSQTLKEVKNNKEVASFEIPSNIFISNNNKNMNVSLMNYWNKENKPHTDDNILYITLSCADFKLLSFTTNQQVIQTYKRKDKYVGIAVIYNETDIKENEEIFRIQAKDNKLNRFVIITFTLSANNEIVKNISTISDNKIIGWCKKEMAKNWDKTFTMMNTPKFPTATFILMQKDKETLQPKIEKIPNVTLIELTDESFTDETKTEFVDSMAQIFDEWITSKRIRAITTCGVRLPRSFCKENKILYLFDYDIENDTTRCVKSN